jgi:hypothetical protein
VTDDELTDRWEAVLVDLIASCVDTADVTGRFE